MSTSNEIYEKFQLGEYSYELVWIFGVDEEMASGGISSLTDLAVEFLSGPVPDRRREPCENGDRSDIQPVLLIRSGFPRS